MIQVVVDDLASVQADAVVRPATDSLKPGAPTLTHLEQAGGSRFREQLTMQEPLAVGAATVTGGGELPTQFVIHAIIRTGSEPVTENGVRRALVSALERAVAWQFRALALPLLGTGPGDLSAKDAASIVCGVLKTHTRDHTFPSDIRIVVQSYDDKDVLERMLHAEER